MNNASFQYLILGSLILFLSTSCKKDELTLSQLDSPPVLDCGDKFVVLDVNDYFITTSGVANVPVCVCDTVEFSLTNVDPTWTFIGWTVIHPIFGFYFDPSSTLRVKNPDEDIFIAADFDDGSVSGQLPSLLVFIEEDPDC